MKFSLTETQRGEEGRATSSGSRNAQCTGDIETPTTSHLHTRAKMAPTLRRCSVNKWNLFDDLLKSVSEGFVM
jgi:hypothetical protein